MVRCGLVLVLRSLVKHWYCEVCRCMVLVTLGEVLVKPSKAKRDDVKVELSFVGRCFVQCGAGEVRSSTVQVLFCFVGSRLGFAKCR